MSVVIVTGTGTDVGKTVATAALAACQGERRVAIVKPAQTGVIDGEPGDLAEVTRLTGITDTFEFARYPDPLSPHHAARISGRPALDFDEAAQRIKELAGEYDLVLVEGAGGLMVPFNSLDEWTLLDLVEEVDAEFALVTQPGLGTLNHTKLTVDRLNDHGIWPQIIIGSWPAEPDLAMQMNVFDLRRMCRRSELGGVLPAGMAAMRDFRQQARAALAPHLGGTWDWTVFRQSLQV